MAFDKNQLEDIEKREKALALLSAWNAASKIVEDADPHIDDDEFRKIDDAADNAYKAYQDFGVDLITDDQNEAVFCEVSGAPLVEGDDLLERVKDGSRYLAAAFELPPPMEEEEQMLPDMEDVA